MTWAKRLFFVALGLGVVLLALWLVRAQIAARFAQRYFQAHGVASSVEIGALGLAGISGRFALGPAAAPDISADRIELHFDPLRWTPRLVEVRLVNPVVRARMMPDGSIVLPTLQQWLQSLRRDTQSHSRFVSDDLAIAFTGLRLLLVTPGGALEVDGDARLVKNLPVFATLTLRPGTLTYQGDMLRVAAAQLQLDATPPGYRLVARLAGDFADPTMAADGVTAHVTIDGLRYALEGGRLTVRAPRLALQLAAKNVRTLDATASNVALDVSARDAGLAQDGPEGDAAFRLTAAVAPAPGTVDRLLKQLPVLAMDRALLAALRANLGGGVLDAKAQLSRHDGQLTFKLDAPLVLKGGKGGVLRLNALTLKGALAGAMPPLRGTLDAALSGGGLPSLTLESSGFATDGRNFSGDAALHARFNFATLRGADVAVRGQASLKDGAFAFRLARCGRVSLAALAPLATQLVSGLCPTGQPLFATDAAGWRLEAQAQGASAFLPLATARLSDASAHLSFQNGGDGAPRGAIGVSAAQIADKAAALRFHPLSGSGSITLAGGLWRGELSAADKDHNRLGAVTFSHAMATGQGSAHIAAPLVFAEDKLQPDTLSPLLAALGRARGKADFSGDLTWTPAGMQSHGALAVRDFDFLTPLGRAHALDADIKLKSLLPPLTEDGQHLAISRIDWTLPLSAIDLRFSFSPAAMQVSALESGIAGGQVTLDSFGVDLAAPGRIKSVASLSAIGLSPLVTATNLGSKLKLEGKVSGRIPFALTPEGFRIADGHLTSDGPGRLSIDRSLWNQQGVSVNAVQDLAYQALENLAFEQMTADINSVANGRLQVLFHIKGKSDPPKPQVAEVAVADIVNGTALQKPITLPSATPIDLTLDTSLNFDELLKSYVEAWSNSFTSAGGAGAGAGARSKAAMKGILRPILYAASIGVMLGGCTPTIRIEVAPISIYAKLDADVRVRLDKEVQSAIQQNPDLF